jgi:hypothetical protein
VDWSLLDRLKIELEQHRQPLSRTSQAESRVALLASLHETLVTSQLQNQERSQDIDRRERYLLTSAKLLSGRSRLIIRYQMAVKRAEDDSWKLDEQIAAAQSKQLELTTWIDAMKAAEVDLIRDIDCVRRQEGSSVGHLRRSLFGWRSILKGREERKRLLAMEGDYCDQRAKASRSLRNEIPALEAEVGRLRAQVQHLKQGRKGLRLTSPWELRTLGDLGFVALETLGSLQARETRVIGRIHRLTREMLKLKLPPPQKPKNVQIDSE